MWHPRVATRGGRSSWRGCGAPAGGGRGLGCSWIATGGLARAVPVQRAAVEAVPAMGAAVVLFCLAALIEGFLSPSAAPYSVKATTAVVSPLILVVYVVGLGARRGN